MLIDIKIKMQYILNLCEYVASPLLFNTLVKYQIVKTIIYRIKKRFIHLNVFIVFK